LENICVLETAPLAADVVSSAFEGPSFGWDGTLYKRIVGLEVEDLDSGYCFL